MKSRKRPPRDWESVIDRAIREAQERGEFDNLPGRGQPLRWDDEHVPAEWRLANRRLKNAGYAPSWIEYDKWIRDERKGLRELLDGFVDWYRGELAALAGKPQTEVAGRLEELELAIDTRIRSYRERAEKLNIRIDDFNLTVPISRLQWHRIRIDEELAKFREVLENNS